MVKNMDENELNEQMRNVEGQRFIRFLKNKNKKITTQKL